MVIEIKHMLPLTMSIWLGHIAWHGIAWLYVGIDSSGLSRREGEIETWNVVVLRGAQLVARSWLDGSSLPLGLIMVIDLI